MSSKNRKFRKKVEDLAGSNEEQPSSLNVPIKGLAAQEKGKEKKPKKISLLSFDEEEGTSPETAKIVPRENSKVTVRPKHRGRSRKDEQNKNEDFKPASTQQSGVGEYSAERLQQLKANAGHYTGPRAPEHEESNGGGFKLSGSFKPAGHKKDDRSDTKLEELKANVSKAAQSKSHSAVKPLVPENLDDEDAAPHVPSAEMIRLAKLKRERMRSAIVAPDYVPLGGAIDLDNLESRLKPEGGLQQASLAADENESGSDEDHRMTFVGNRYQSQQPGQNLSAEPQVATRDEDDDDHWVNEQIRKGVGVGQTAKQNSQAAAAAYNATAAARYANGGPILTAKAAAHEVSQMGDLAMKALQQNFARLKATRANVQKQAAKTDENIRDSITECTNLEERLHIESTKYTFLQELKAYIADLCDMLQAKAAIVEELEDHMMRVGEARAAALAQRSAGDGAAELDPASAAVSAALGVLSRGGATSAARAAASSAAKHSEERLRGAAGPVELDEFGRDVGMANAEESKRIERRQARERHWKDDPEGQGGAETTDESDSEERQYSRQRQEVIQTARSVFADAAEEYGTLGKVKQRLEGWRHSHPDAYSNAYAADSVPAIFAPFVRNELLSWDPIFVETKDFDSQAWYTVLLDYGRAEKGDGEPGDEDELIPKLVADLVVPLANHAIQVCWNTFSRRHTKRVVKLLEHLLVYLPVEHAKMQELLKEAQSRLEAAIGLVKLPPWPAAAVSAAPEASAFLTHRFGKAVRLVANITAFDSLLPRSLLLSMVWERLFQQQLLSYMLGESGSVEASIKRAERFAEVLPKAWLQGGVPQPAKPFAEHLKKLARSLESRRKDGLPSTAPSARRLLRALDKFGDKDASKKLASVFHLKE